MKRIYISSQIDYIAKDFRLSLLKGKGTYINPIKKLEKLKDSISTDHHDNYIRYIEKIIEEWDNLIIMHPSDFEKTKLEFSQILNEAALSKKEFGDTKFYEYIVKAMRYDYVQSTIYPNFINKLRIKTCVYCNSQYAFAIKTSKDKYINYELDHWKPMSKYPFLCTSFFNLQPCCPKCNKNKSNNDALFQLYTENVSDDLYPMHFSVSDKSICQYLTTHNNDYIQILFDCKENNKLKTNEENLFHISVLYQGHKDIAEELIWKNQIYNSVFQNIYFDDFKRLNFTKSDFQRFIIGNYVKNEDIHKRPLNKMTKDIALQFGLINDDD